MARFGLRATLLHQLKMQTKTLSYLLFLLSTIHIAVGCLRSVDQSNSSGATAQTTDLPPTRIYDNCTEAENSRTACLMGICEAVNYTVSNWRDVHCRCYDGYEGVRCHLHVFPGRGGVQNGAVLGSLEVGVIIGAIVIAILIALAVIICRIRSHNAREADNENLRSHQRRTQNRSANLNGDVTRLEDQNGSSDTTPNSTDSMNNGHPYEAVRIENERLLEKSNNNTKEASV